MIDDEKYEIFNCLTLRDTENSNDLVFKTSASNCAYLYCQQRLKDLVKELDLRGVVFRS